MIDIQTAGLIAKIVSDAIGSFDKIFRGYIDVVMRKTRAGNLPPPHFVYVNSPEQSAFLAKSQRTGDIRRKVTYDQLCKALNDSDLEYIQALSQAMENYQQQWNSVYVQRSMAGDIQQARMDTQLEYLAKQIADPLIKVLGFIEKMGLSLA